MGVRLFLLACLTLALGAPAGALAQGGTGSISGKVTDGEGDTTARFCVLVTSLSDPNYNRPLVLFDDGTYTASGLAPGRYIVEFRGCGAFASYPPEFWDDAITPEAAKVIELGDGEARTGVDAVMDRGSTVSGRVTDAAGNPLAGICVTAAGPSDAVLTDAAGSYRLKGLEQEGRHTVTFSECERPGRVYLEQYRLVDVPWEAEHITGIDVVLARGGHIGGRVTNFEGDPLALVCVFAQRNPPDFPIPGGRSWVGYTDADGRYRTAALNDGSYLMTFQPCPITVGGAALFTQYYREQASPETATMVDISATQSREDIDARLVDGSKPCVVPEVTGKTLRKARRLIGDTRCEVGKIRGKAKPGSRVSGQAPEWNTVRPRDAKVKLVLR